jgi:hypothetical protein
LNYFPLCLLHIRRERTAVLIHCRSDIGMAHKPLCTPTGVPMESSQVRIFQVDGLGFQWSETLCSPLSRSFCWELLEGADQT